MLVKLAGAASAFGWSGFGRSFNVTPVELVVGVLLLAFALVELVPRWRDGSFDPRWMPLGGVLSGFFGGLYAGAFRAQMHSLDYRVLAAAVLAATLGALLGSRLLLKVTMPGVQRAVAVMLFVVALGMMSGLL